MASLINHDVFYAAIPAYIMATFSVLVAGIYNLRWIIVFLVAISILFTATSIFQIILKFISLFT